MEEDERLAALRAEYTYGLWWIDWCKLFWGRLGIAYAAQEKLRVATDEWNALKKVLKIRQGRPKGSSNRAAREPLGEESL